MNMESLELALSFISEQPHAASRIMEQQPLELAADFVESIPLTYQAELVRYLMPAYAARLLARLDNESAFSVAGQLDTSVLTRILRLMDTDKSELILQGLRTGRRRACESLLNYPNYAIGAWMEPEVAVVNADMNAGEARNYLKNTCPDEDVNQILVTDRQGRLEGRVSCLALFSANPIQLVHELMSTDPPWMSPNFLLEQAAESYLWDNNDVVVVTDRDHHILGLLRHADLRLGLVHREERAPSIRHDNPDLVASLVTTYGAGLEILFSTVLDVVETDLKS